MNDVNVKSVRYPISVDIKFEKIALKLGRTKRSLFIQMVDYFYKSKKDPADLNDEFLKNTLLKNHKDYIGFIRTQETELLIPVKRDVGRMIESQKKLLNCFNTQILGHNKTMVNSQQALADKFQQVDELMKLIFSKSDTKDTLKRKFLYILDNYIQTRESFNLMTSGKEKEELIHKTRTQVNQL